MDKLPREVAVTVKALCQDINTPRSLTVQLLCENGEYEQLARLRCDPKYYDDAERFRLDNSVTELLRKCADLPVITDRKKAALESFFNSEKLCSLTNSRLIPYILQYNEDPAIAKFFEMVKAEISSILGRSPTADEIVGRFGPGSVFESKRQRTLVPDKLSTRPTLTDRALKFLPLWRETAWGRISSVAFDKSLETVPGNRFTTVPKTALIDRGICVEPSFNGFYQMAYGRLIRDKLRRFGLDLNSSHHDHRRMARAASRLGHLATIDLSSASDTVAYNLVKLLLPDQWFEDLESLRSPCTHINKRWFTLSKFSSMGNGYTFELETLIFFSISRVVMRMKGLTPISLHNIAVFGDDIIVPTEVAPLLIRTLAFCGFTINSEKTYISGAFRESCGGDFFHGYPVRAHYMKAFPNEPQDFITLANGLRRVANQDDLDDDIHPRYLRGWLRVVDCIPTSARYFGPSALGDLVIHDRRSHWKQKYRNSIRYIRTYSPVKGLGVPIQRYCADTVLASAVYGVITDNGKLHPRNSVVGYKPAWVPYS